MAILGLQAAQPTGLASVTPSVVYILTNDTYATVTATGYLNNAKQEGFTFNNQQMALVYTSDDGPVWLKVVITFSGATILNTVVSLVEISSPGDVVLPTIANHIIVSANTTGTLENLTGIAINNGSLQAGLSGTAGTLISYPATASKGSLILAGVANTGNTNTTISNNAMGQASVINIPDPANAIGQLLVAATATPFTTAHLVASSGTAGLVVDSGVATSNLQLKTQVKAVLTGNIGGAGAGPLTVTVAGMTAASVVVATVSSSSNPCYVLTTVAGTGSFALTVNTDPGASLIVNYIAYIAAQ